MTENANILIVDDEEDSLEFLQTILEDNGYQVHTAMSAQAAMKSIAGSTPDLVCLDVLMPQESGVSLYHKLKTDERYRNIPVVINSGLNIRKDLTPLGYLNQANGQKLPAPEGILEKPVDVSALLKILERVLT